MSVIDVNVEVGQTQDRAVIKLLREQIGGFWYNILRDTPMEAEFKETVGLLRHYSACFMNQTNHEILSALEDQNVPHYNYLVKLLDYGAFTDVIWHTPATLPNALKQSVQSKGLDTWLCSLPKPRINLSDLTSCANTHTYNRGVITNYLLEACPPFEIVDEVLVQRIGSGLGFIIAEKGVFYNITSIKDAVLTNAEVNVLYNYTTQIENLIEFKKGGKKIHRRPNSIGSIGNYTQNLVNNLCDHLVVNNTSVLNEALQDTIINHLKTH